MSYPIDYPMFESSRRKEYWLRTNSTGDLIEAIKDIIENAVDRVYEHIRFVKGKNPRVEIPLKSFWDSDIKRIQKHLRSRKRVGKVVANIVASLNNRDIPYNTTDFWGIVPMVTPSYMIGLVDITRGCAVKTNIRISRIDAFRVAYKSSGIIASNAARYSYPDVGEPHHTTCPEGWKQLFVDVRGGTAGSMNLESDCWTKITGLRTCYDGKIGKPCDQCWAHKKDYCLFRSVPEKQLIKTG
jgi:hypothetical protein